MNPTKALDKCYTEHMHAQWGITEVLPLTRQRNLKQSEVDSLCKASALVVSEYRRRKRNLNFCAGCVAWNTSTNLSFHDEFETFAKRPRQEGHMGPEEPPVIIHHTPILQGTRLARSESKERKQHDEEDPSSSI